MAGVTEGPEEIKTTVSASPGSTLDTLRHHGDVETAPGLVDFAVNVQGEAPPPWLRDRLAATLGDLARYPTAEHDRRAREAVARRHGRDPAEVLILAGSAEGFALIPALRPRHAAVVHPGFTEPEAALRGAGLPVTHVLTRGDHRLDPAAVPEAADLVVVGNPTNPTGVLHPAADLRALLRPGRVLLVDEAFADAVPGEPESLAGEPGALVFRSLTKTWALAGLRAGYALGDPAVLARLAAPRPHWPVGTLALEAVIACSEPAAVAEAKALARVLAEHRDRQAAALAAVPGVEVLPGRAPYLLLKVPEGTRERLRDKGIAVRRCDTFPGLGADHVRVAVREPARAAVLVEALREILVGVAA
ncbi:Rv2231c family pyridoxal phosphate-dependent protein CobC [Pseudonocardia xishanensis]|uniref:Aminotransferase n=1 Tax=Pseudonocardia xishanensis TaxID=630995 RepID=A0ABP8S3X7_9PSEU